VLLSAKLLPDEKGHEVGWRDVSAQVGPLRINGSQHPLFRQRAVLSRYLRRAGAQHPVPAIDFSRRQLLLVSPGPRSSTGYGVDILSVREHEGKITVRIRERAPKLGEPVEARVTYPYRLLSLPAGDDVYVDWVGR
jgi:PrcB C-terminal